MSQRPEREPKDGPVPKRPPFRDSGRYVPFLDGLLKARGLSRTEFARRMGRTKAWATMLLRGQRGLVPLNIDAVAKVLDLDEAERLELKARVEHSQANSSDARQRAERYLEGLEGRRAAEHTSRLAKCVASWRVGAVLELARCEGYRPDPRWIAFTVYPRITVAQATEALDVLRELGMLDDDYQLADVPPNLGTQTDILDDAELSAMARAIHREGFAIAADAVDVFAGNERLVQSGIVALTEDGFAKLREGIQELLASAFFGASPAEEEKPTRLYRLLLGLFPASLYTDTEYDPTEIED